ncbi:MAG: TIGR04086 family membrane protein [Oscillospiraceae bacterium]|nr:TIGR04086 family membrane protein [Oscillospiraceae bacterium]
MTKNGFRRDSAGAMAARPAVIGLVAAVASSLVMCMLIAFVFSLAKSLAEAAVLPLSFGAVGAGCFLGAYACSRMTGRRGVAYGLIIGFSVFFLVWVAGLFFSGAFFGTASLVKLAVTLTGGAAGGYSGMTGTGGKRRRRGR